MAVFLMMVLVFAAAVPLALRGTQQGSNYTEAALIAQHKMDQLRSANFSTLGSPSALISAGIINGVNGDGTYDFSANGADNLASFFPAGTTGKIALAPDTSTGTMQGGVYDVTITLAWPTSGAHAGSFTLKNKIINY